MQNQNQNNSPHVVQFVLCGQCGRRMQFQGNSDSKAVYKDSMGHIRKIDRPGGQRIYVQGPNNAA